MDVFSARAGTDPAKVFFWIFGSGGVGGSHNQMVKRSMKIVQDALLWLRFPVSLDNPGAGRIENKWAKCVVTPSEVGITSSGAVSIGLVGNTLSVEMDFDFLRDRFESLHHIESQVGSGYLAVRIVEESFDWNHFSSLYFENGRIENSYYRREILSPEYIRTVGVNIYLDALEPEIASLRRAGMPTEKILSHPACQALLDSGVNPMETKWRRYLLPDYLPGDGKQKTGRLVQV